jgi:uncharacterized cupin superfamily protein
MTKKIDVSAISAFVGTRYPAPFYEPCLASARKRIGDAAGLTQLGVNMLTLPPGAWSSQRHWHTSEDELVYVLSGEVTLVTDAGPEILRAGDAAGFTAGDSNGHCLQNHTDQPATVLEIGSRVKDDVAYYPGIDLVGPSSGKPAIYTHRDGTPYTDLKHRSK